MPLAAHESKRRIAVAASLCGAILCGVALMIALASASSGPVVLLLAAVSAVLAAGVCYDVWRCTGGPE